MAHLDLALLARMRKDQAGEQEQRQQRESHWRLIFLFSSSCSLRQRILPVAVFGSSSTNSTRRGTLNAAIFSRAQSMMSFEEVFFEVLFRTITAFTVSPR